jgi:uncharacterized protein YndB with AHSA1/START domain
MPDRIEKQALILAPRSRVWRAIVDQTEFGTWFRVAFPAGTFTPGENVRGRITYPGYEHLVMDIDVVEVTPEERLSFRWEPYEVDPGTDRSSVPRTLVTFTLEDGAGGTLVNVVDSGFDRLPPDRRDEAFRANEGGWAEQMQNIDRHVTASG